MKKYNKFLIGLVMAAVALFAIAATQQSDAPRPFEIGSIVQFKMENDMSEGGGITSIAGKWVKLETQYANDGPKHIRWVNTDFVRTISFPVGTPTASK